MMSGMFQISQDVNGSYNGWYTCPECGKANLLFAQDQRHECSCSQFIVDLGQPLQDFASSENTRVSPMAANASN